MHTIILLMEEDIMKFDKIIDDIADSYNQHNNISKIDTVPQPDKTMILDILTRLQDIV